MDYSSPNNSKFVETAGKMLLSNKQIAELKLQCVSHSGKRHVEGFCSSEPLMKLGVS